jgi:hypothetical protein
VGMRGTDLVGINGITRVLSVYTCQQGVYPRGHVLPLRFPQNVPRFFILKTTVFRDVASCSLIKTDRRFIGAYCLYYQGDELAVSTS